MTGKVHLMEEIRSTPVKPGELVFWWLGQMGLAVKTCGKLLFFDPFLSDHPHRLSPAPFSGGELVGAHIVFGSHDHDDHIDFPVWKAAAQSDPSTVFVVPELIVATLTGRGFPAERMGGINDGCRSRMAGVWVTGVAASHEFLDRDPVSGRYPYMGYLVEVDGFRIYHPGDTCVYDGLIPKLSHSPIDLCILPINGRDAVRYARGIIGNMTYQEAVDLAGAVHPRLTIPGHYDMVEGNTADPQLFTAYLDVKYPHAGHMIPPYCQPVRLERDKAPLS